MKRERAIAIGVIVLTAAVLGVYLLTWTQVTPQQIGRSDFTPSYVAGLLWNSGHHADLYNPSLQAAEHARVIAPDTEGNLPFPYPPTALLVMSPIAHLSLGAAYRIFALLQFSCLVTAVALAAWAAPFRDGRHRLAAGLTLAPPATLALLLLGQWDGFSALGLAGAYALWRRGHFAWGGAVLAFAAVGVKPHLAVGLGALLLGWRDRRILVGAVAGTAVAVTIDLLAVGPAGIGGLIHVLIDDAGRWNPAGFLSFVGFAGSWLGNNSAGQAVAALLSVVALGGCVVIGDRLRRRPDRLSRALLAATALSLVASPHLLAHDLVVLAPALAWSLGDADEASGRWPGRQSLRLIGLVVVLALVEMLDLGNDSAAPPGRLVPLLLVGIGVVAAVSANRASTMSARVTQ